MICKNTEFFIFFISIIKLIILVIVLALIYIYIINKLLMSNKTLNG